MTTTAEELAERAASIRDALQSAGGKLILAEIKEMRMESFSAWAGGEGDLEKARARELALKELLDRLNNKVREGDEAIRAEADLSSSRKEDEHFLKDRAVNEELEALRAPLRAH